MAVALVSGSVAATANNVGNATPVSLALTISATGANTALVVLIHNAQLASTLSSVKWNTTESLTEIGSQSYGSYHDVSAYILLNPTATSSNVVVTYSANPGYGTKTVAFLLTGVNSSTPTADGTGNGGSRNASSVSIANMTSGDMAIAISGTERQGSSYSTTTGTTLDNSLGNNWADTGSAYNTGTGSVSIAFSHYNEATATYGFRVVQAATTTYIPKVIII
jgi:hypothetical protein